MSNNNLFWITFSCLMVVFGFFGDALAYHDEAVHPVINEKALSSQDSNIDDYLKNILGFSNGIEEIVYDKSIKLWVNEGGTNEDSPRPRTLNHFHDPLKPWGQAGLPFNQSALLWAQEPFQHVVLKGGSYSWVTARLSFYDAIINNGEVQYALAFQSLGQVMHLVSDMAVPAHVRSDTHPISRPYENYVTDHIDAWKLDHLNSSYVPYNVNKSIFNNAVYSSLAPVPISALWDKNVYTGGDPDELWNYGVGLAEFTNANFLSRDTFHDYPNPDLSGQGVQYDIAWHDRTPVLAEDNAYDTPAYAYRVVNGDRKYRLGAMNYFAIETDNGNLSGPRVKLDDEVYSDYADQLIPRAISYSAALLDYFFRGKLTISAPDRYVYGIADSADFFAGYEQVFDQIVAKIGNASNEGIGGGSLVAIAKYKRRSDYYPSLINEPPNPLFIADEYTYNVSAPTGISGLATPTDIAFNFSINPIPAGITDLSLYVVFQGTLGGEQDIAVAVGYIDLSEPTFYQLSNNTDRFYEIDGNNTEHLYAEGEDPYLGAIDYNYDVTFDLGFYPEPGTFNGYQYTVTLGPAEYATLGIIAEAASFNVLLYDRSLPDKAGVNPDEQNVIAVNNQNITASNPGVDSFFWRGTYLHDGHGHFNSWIPPDVWFYNGWPDLIGPPVEFQPY